MSETDAMNVFVVVDKDMNEEGYRADRVDLLPKVSGGERNFEETVNESV